MHYNKTTIPKLIQCNVQQMKQVIQWHMGQECIMSWSAISSNNTWACPAPSFLDVVGCLWSCDESYTVSTAATSSVQPSRMPAHWEGGVESGTTDGLFFLMGMACSAEAVTSLDAPRSMSQAFSTATRTRCGAHRSLRAKFSALQKNDQDPHELRQGIIHRGGDKAPNVRRGRQLGQGSRV